IEKELDKQLRSGKKKKRGHLKTRFFYVSVARGEIFKALQAGKGDIAAANLSITPQRQALIDFAAPSITDVSEVVLTGPESPAVSSLDDLGGKEVFVRRSSSYYEHLTAL